MSQLRGGGVWTIWAIAKTRVILFIKALSRTTAKTVSNYAGPLAASGRAVGIGGRVDVRVVQGRRVVAMV